MLLIFTFLFGVFFSFFDPKKDLLDFLFLSTLIFFSDIGEKKEYFFNLSLSVISSSF